MKKIILDVDTGVDDAFAISLALNNKQLDLIGITTVFGNAPLDNVLKNTFNILDINNHLDIPVYKGASKCLCGNENSFDNAHGTNGFGDLNLSDIPKKDDGDAINYLINTVNKYKKQITIVCCGPLTNIASCLLNSPTFATNLKSLIIMGGSLKDGNITKNAEFNFYNDAKAANIVLNSDISDIKVIGWDTSINVFLDEEHEENMKNSENKVINLLYNISRKNADFDRSKGRGGAVLSDPLTIAYLLNPRLFKFKKVSIKVDTSGNTEGMCQVTNGIKKINFATYVNKNKFIELLFNKIKI